MKVAPHATAPIGEISSVRDRKYAPAKPIAMCAMISRCNPTAGPKAKCNRKNGVMIRDSG